MSDGSNLGITAGRALGTILGGEPSPAEDEQTSKEQTLERVLAAPSPMTGEGSLWDQLPKEEGHDPYSVATDAITKAFLMVEAEEPGSLTEKHYYSAENCDYEGLWGKEIGGESIMWDKVKERYPDFDDWIGGASGFMVGFAYNCARWLSDLHIVGNPALMTIRLPEE